MLLGSAVGDGGKGRTMTQPYASTVIHQWKLNGKTYRMYRQDHNGEPYYSVMRVGDDQWMTHGQSFRVMAHEFDRLIKEKA